MTAMALSSDKCNGEVYHQPLFFVKLELSDGSSEVVSLTEKQIADLGIKITNSVIIDVNEEKLVESKADRDPLENCDQLDESPINVDDECTEVNYQIIHPEDLNLKRPAHMTYLPKGRPKKRQQSNQNKINTETAVKSPKHVKSTRTRSGRVTKPPKHFEKDFKKIDLMETTVEGDIVAKEFEPLSTNEKSERVPKGETRLFQLEVHRKKRIITSQYRCSACNKAYLGQLRLIKHFQKYPDHDNRNRGQKQYNNTWKHLIETSMKAANGSRAKTFCEELSLLIQNARLLAKYLFKLSEEESAIELDDLLATILGVGPGKYTLNENDLCKDVTLFSYLDMNYFDETYLSTGSEVKEPKPVALHGTQDIAKSVEAIETKTDDYVKNSRDDGGKGLGKEKCMIIDFGKKDKKPIVDDIKKGDYVIQNPLLSDVDGLMLPEVDSSQNILDTSTNSDDIMNVDQFVNERFKKLTEPELDMTNASLNLDLPALELFQFHGT